MMNQRGEIQKVQRSFSCGSPSPPGKLRGSRLSIAKALGLEVVDVEPTNRSSAVFRTTLL
jgi:hypothetical protein